MFLKSSKSYIFEKSLRTAMNCAGKNENNACVRHITKPWQANWFQSG